MLDVFFTIDVEVWCDGWQNIDAKFPDAFRRYVYGPTSRGDIGLPFQCKVLNDYGLTGVFFVEPLFSTRFGSQPLDEIVGLLRSEGQEVQIHLHPEWVDESPVPLLLQAGRKRQHLRYYSIDEQRTLIRVARDLLGRAGAPDTNAFRAGSFAFNLDTLRALSQLGIPIDSSYNGCMYGLDSGVMPGVLLVDVARCEGVLEYPMTVFRDGTSSLRHAQLTACSAGELEGLLWQALEQGRNSFTLLSHNFELLNPGQRSADPIAIDRFLRLCSFLAKNRDSFCVRGFRDLEVRVGTHMPDPLVSPIWRTAHRMLEQLYRRRYRYHGEVQDTVGET